MTRQKKGPGLGGTGTRIISGVTRPVLNRRQRRAQAARRPTLHALDRQAGGAFRLDVVHPLDVLANPTLLRAVADWRANVTHHRPLCLCLDCTFEWTAPEQAAPALFAIVQPFDNPAATVSSLSAICARCAARSDLRERMLDSLRQLWPDLRELDFVHGGPGRQQ